MPGGLGVANLLHDHTSQILDKNQEDLNFSIDLQRTIQASSPSHLHFCAALV